MGTYVYTLRKKNIKSPVLGKMENVHLFSYLSKPFSSGFLSDRRDTRTELGLGRAEHAWKDGIFPTYCVSMDSESVNKPVEDEQVNQLYPVYTNIRSCIWYDTAKFPGDLVGYIHVCDGKATAFFTVQQQKELYAEWLKVLDERRNPTPVSAQ